MEKLPFEDEEFDVIWSEGAIYNIGFEKGIADWKRYFKPGGLIIASEITWLTNSRPSELQDHWNNEYPEIDTASAKIKILEESGYIPIGYFVLPEHCWLDNYYEPMRKSFDAFLSRNGEARRLAQLLRQSASKLNFMKNTKRISATVYISQGSSMRKSHNKALHSDKFSAAAPNLPVSLALAI